jgi:Double zinc ribbon
MPGRFASLFARPRPPEAEPATDAAPDDTPPPEAYAEPPPAGPPRPVPPERHRRFLMRQREVELRDVGGLAVEMARRDDWRYGLLHTRCAEVLALEERIHELDAFIAASEIAARAPGELVRCACGAPLLRGSHFCSHCGRPALDTPPVAMCSHCGQPLPAEANFCSVCGNAVAAEAYEEAAIDDTIVTPVPRRDDEPGAY